MLVAPAPPLAVNPKVPAELWEGLAVWARGAGSEWVDGQRPVLREPWRLDVGQKRWAGTGFLQWSSVRMRASVCVHCVWACVGQCVPWLVCVLKNSGPWASSH